jgi:tRNA-specific 2-thiouridylase
MADKVLVAMSGGVDSSVALIKIIEQGYEPIGVTMKLWDYNDVGGNLVNETNCCSVESINTAKLVCDKMGFPHYTLDFTGVFKETVVENFVSEYLSGRTPNPCVRCNSFVKWDAFIQQADQLGAKYISTGHYAQIEEIGDEYSLLKGVDPVKDQAYVLWGIPKETLSRTLLPLGGLHKTEVREIARKHNLESAETPESMEICFVADNNYKRFLSEYSPNEIDKIGEGNIVNENGKTLGKHSGFTDYTVGQRKGLGLSFPEPRYVKEINPENNQIVVGEKNSLYSESCNVKHLNWLIDNPDFPSDIQCQIRYNSTAVNCTISKKEHIISVVFKEPQLAVTPGQSIVFYDKDRVLGGGIIELS